MPKYIDLFFSQAIFNTHGWKKNKTQKILNQVKKKKKKGSADGFDWKDEKLIQWLHY